MNNIIIGDIHGRDCWKQIDADKYDDIVFIGDYVDNPNIPSEKQLQNLKDIVDFQKQYPNKVTLLIGNHDEAYIKGRLSITGIQMNMVNDFKEVYKEANLKVAKRVGDYLCTHAGVHVGWFEKFKLESEFLKVSNKPLDIQLNLAYSVNLPCLSDIGVKRGGGQDVGGVFWLDKSHLQNKPAFKNQIVGHTKVDDITEINGITFIDCLEHKTKFLEINGFDETSI